MRLTRCVSGNRLLRAIYAAAQLEGSKAFAKEVMACAGVPTAIAHTCTSAEEAVAALDAFGPPYVVKDDGLAAGKGVVVTDDRDEAIAHAAACERVVVEEYLDGPEVSLFCVSDGTMLFRWFLHKTSNGSETETPGRTPAAWAPTPLYRGQPPTLSIPSLRRSRNPRLMNCAKWALLLSACYTSDLPCPHAVYGSLNSMLALVILRRKWCSRDCSRRCHDCFMARPLDASTRLERCVGARTLL